MEHEVEKLFQKAVLEQAAAAFGLDPHAPMQLLGDFENYVYAAAKDGVPVIVRLTHSSHRSEAQVRAELDWIHELVRQGISVPACYRSINGAPTEKIAVKDSYFTVIVMEQAAGHLPDYANEAEWNAALFQEWGRVTGRMHRVTSSYAVPSGSPMRPHWHEDDLLVHASDYVSIGNRIVLQRLEALQRQLAGLPQRNDAYGLIHTDIHSRNFFVENGRITVFDFDDCTYHWFVQDIAIPLYYAVSWSVPVHAGRDSFGNAFLQAFWQGYRAEYVLDPAWLRHVPLFLKLRDMVLYLVLQKKTEPDQRSERIRTWLAEIEDRIVRDIPIVRIDFKALDVCAT
ncbi:phosphotransferase enzyme family protein [Paenibacillus sp. GCM10023248]|uniref:phosphotransferase enzyme family protein n=1 Tax=unclassified Paenibacillus TaxID=185978 RepID=UPI002378E0E4|nr:phosphotransferase [Paenibacillus sp. MAHUQ-63]MDD9268153.1 phosphotransferase [Paenibacillus sp. MAHUQ-63]